MGERRAQKELRRSATCMLPALCALALFTMAGCRNVRSNAASMPTAKGANSPRTGTVAVVGPTTCEPGVASAASCTSIKVSCAGLPDLGATLAVAGPAGRAEGTVILLSGGPGIRFLNGGFVNAYVRDGFRVVEVAWASDWASANGAGLKSTACRPSTVFKYVFHAVHRSSRATGFCGQGISGGGAQLAYSVTQYGLANYFDYVIIAAGPAVARMDYGCDPLLYTGAQRNLCPLLTNAPFSYNPKMRMFNHWENTTTCSTSKPLAADISRWRDDSIVAPDAKFTYPHTSMTWFFCVTLSTINASTGQGSFLIDEVRPKDGPPDINCYSGHCRGEAVWMDPKAFSATESEMLAKCVPNHVSFH